MKTTFEDFEKTTLYANLVETTTSGIYKAAPSKVVQVGKDIRTAIKTAFLVGHQLGLDEARAILTGERDIPKGS